MGLGDFWLQSNNGKKISLDNLKELKKSDLKNNPELIKLFDIFNTNKSSGSEEVLDKQELNSLFNTFSKAAQSQKGKNTSIFETEEAEDFINSNSILQETNIKTSDLFDFLSKIVKPQNEQKTISEPSRKTKTNQEVKAGVIESLRSDSDETLKIISNMNNGDISDIYDSVKTFLDMDTSKAKVLEAAVNQAQGAKYMEKAQSGGLTREEYIKANKQRLQDMMKARLYKKDKNGIDYLDKNRADLKMSRKEFEALMLATIERMTDDMDIKSVKEKMRQLPMTTENGDRFLMDSIKQNAIVLFGKAKSAGCSTLDLATKYIYDTTKIVKPSPDDKKLLTFDEVFYYEQGVNYSKEDCEKYLDVQTQLTKNLSSYNKYLEFKTGADKILKEKDAEKALNDVIKLFEQFYSDPSYPNLAYKNLKSVVKNSNLPINVTQDETGRISISMVSGSEDLLLSYVTDILAAEGNVQQERLDKAFGGNAEEKLEELQKEVEQAHEKAYGNDFSSTLGKAMIEDNQTFIQRYTGNASMTGMGLTVVGGVLCFTPAAALGAAMITAGNTLAIGGMAAESGLGFYEASTRKNGAEDGEYEELTKTMLMNLGGFGFGGAAGKTGMKLFNKFVSKELDSLPKLSEAFKSAMVKGNRAEALKIVCSQPEYRKQFAKGLASKLLSDFSISYAGDLVMMGVLDTQDDWESLLQSNLIGILAGMGGDIKDAAHLGMKGDKYRALKKKEQEGTITQKEIKELALLRQDADIRNLSGVNDGVNDGAGVNELKPATEAELNVLKNGIKLKLLEPELKEHTQNLLKIAEVDVDIAKAVQERNDYIYGDFVADYIIEAAKIDKKLTLKFLSMTCKRSLKNRLNNKTEKLFYHLDNVLDAVKSAQIDYNLTMEIVNFARENNLYTNATIPHVLSLAQVDKDVAFKLYKEKGEINDGDAINYISSLKMNRELTLKLLEMKDSYGNKLNSRQINTIVYAYKKDSDFMANIHKQVLSKELKLDEYYDIAKAINMLGSDFAYKKVEQLTNAQKRILLDEISGWKFQNGRTKIIDEMFPCLPKTTDSDSIINLINRLTKELNTKPQQLPENKLVEFNTQIEKLYSNIDTNSIKTIVDEFLPEYKEDITDNNLSKISNAVKRITNDTEFSKLSENDKKITIISSILSNIKSKNDTQVSIVEKVYNTAFKLGFSESDAKTIYSITETSNLIEQFMSTSKRKIPHNYMDKFDITHRETIFNQLAFKLKEGNTFSLAKLVYSSVEQEGLTRFLDKLLEQKVNEMKADDFVLYQTPAEEYVAKAHKETITDNKTGTNYDVMVVNSDEIENFYAIGHNTDGVSGLTGDVTEQQKYAKLTTLENITNDRAYCGFYMDGENICAIKDGFIFVVPNDKFYAASGHDIGSLGKSVPEIINEYFIKNDVEATTHDRSGEVETKNEERKMVSKNLKEILGISDDEYIQRLDNIKLKLQGKPFTPDNVRVIDSEFADAYKEFLSRVNTDETQGKRALLSNKQWNEVIVSNPKIGGIYTRNLAGLSEDKLIFARDNNIPIVVLRKKTKQSNVGQVATDKNPVQKMAEAKQLEVLDTPNNFFDDFKATGNDYEFVDTVDKNGNKIKLIKFHNNPLNSGYSNYALMTPDGKLLKEGLRTDADIKEVLDNYGIKLDELEFTHVMGKTRTKLSSQAGMSIDFGISKTIARAVGNLIQKYNSARLTERTKAEVNEGGEGYVVRQSAQEANPNKVLQMKNPDGKSVLDDYAGKEYPYYNDYGDFVEFSAESGAKTLKKTKLQKNEDIIEVSNFADPGGTVAGSSSLNQTLVTDDLMQCSAITIVDKANNRQTLIHLDPGLSKEDNRQILEHVLSQSKASDLDISVVSGFNHLAPRTVQFVLDTLGELAPDNKINLYKFDKTSTVVVLKDGKISCCDKDNLRARQDNIVTNPEGQITYCSRGVNDGAGVNEANPVGQAVPDKNPAQKAEAEKPASSKTDAKASPQHIVVGNKLFELNSKFGEPTKDAIEEVKAEIERLSKTEPEKADNLQIVLDMFTTPTEAKKVTETQIDAVVKYLDEHYGHKESYLTTQVKKLGLNILGKFGNRMKGLESTRDKVANYIADAIKDENEAIKKGENFTPKTLLDAYNDVRDKYACRTVFEMGDYTKAPTVANLINEAKALKLQGKIKEASVKMHEAELKAAELQSKDVAETIKQSILKAKENDADLNVMRISNYVSSDGIPILSESQLSEIKYFAAQQGINVEFIRLASEIDPSLTPEQRKEQEKKLTTKSQPSGYTALQINFVTKTGEVIEWQFRGELVDRFAEAEHLPYDLRTGKHPWKQIPELEPLYKPIADLLNEDVMPKHAYKQINRYFTDYYTHLRRLELGFDSEEPKLSNYENYRAKDENGVERNFTYKFDKRLEAKNLIALHDFAEGIKDGLITSERAVEEFNMFLRN